MVAELHIGKNSTRVGWEETNEAEKQGPRSNKSTAATAIVLKLIILPHSCNPLTVPTAALHHLMAL